MLNKTVKFVLVLAALAALVLAGCEDTTGDTTEYSITITAATGGTVTADVSKAAEGDTVTLTVTPAAEMRLVSGSLMVNNGEVAVSGTGPEYTFEMPGEEVMVTVQFASIFSTLTFQDGGAVKVRSYPGYQNTMAADAFDVSLVNRTDTGYTLITLGADDAANTVGSWNDTGLDLGSQTLAFEYGSNAQDGHVVLSFKDFPFGDFSGKTGLEFTVMLPDIPNAGAIGFMPHVRYNDGTSENTVVFAREWWAYQLADNAFFTVRIPFTSMAKPGYSDANSYTTVADAVAGGVVFNQLDFDFRVHSPESGTTDGTVYTGYIDNIKLY